MSIGYYRLRYEFRKRADRARVAQSLRDIRKQAGNIRALKQEDTILLATWNIRDFGGESSGGFNPRGRIDEAYFYIAEYLSSFDLVAVQEVNEDLRPLETIMRILGSDWDFIATDTFTFKGRRGERLCYLYNKKRVKFQKIAGEIVLPFGEQIPATQKIKAEGLDPELVITDEKLQFARTPFLVSFQAGWLKFNLCTVHIYFGENSSKSAKFDRRKREISGIAKHLAKRQEKDQQNYILLGDFNIKNEDDVTMEQLRKSGFRIPEEIGSKGTNIKGDKHYDQIAVRTRDGDLRVRDSGVVNIFSKVFKSSEKALEPYLSIVEKDRMKDKTYKDKSNLQYYKNKWRTWQMSDHNILWTCLETDFSDDYLKRFSDDD